MLEVNASAPNPAIETHTGYKGPISHFWQEGPLILFFYPKDDTVICTKQACTLQSSMGEFGSFGAQVLGSGGGDLASHHAFSKKHQLTFPLVLDARGALAQAYDAFRSLLRIPKRVTYIINQEGKIQARLHDELSVTAHLNMIRKALE